MSVRENNFVSEEFYKSLKKEMLNPKGRKYNTSYQPTKELNLDDIFSRERLGLD